MGSARRLEAIQNQARLRFTYPPIAIASMGCSHHPSSIIDSGYPALLRSSRGKNRLSAILTSDGLTILPRH
jgi:hypothetical protein